jgi:hypothetical protein
MRKALYLSPLWILLLLGSGWWIVAFSSYQATVGSHITVATKAYTREQMLTELDASLQGAEELHLCNEAQSDPNAAMFTSIFVDTADEDICLWRRNLVAVKERVALLPPDSTFLPAGGVSAILGVTTQEKVLAQAREAIAETPEGIYAYPYNGWGILLVLSWVTLFFTTIFWATDPSPVSQSSEAVTGAKDPH